MEPIEYLRLLRRRWRLLAACVLVAGTVAWITTPASPTGRQLSFEATHVLLRDDTAVTPPPSLAQVALFVRTGDVPGRVAERLDLDVNPGVLANRIEAIPDDSSASLQIMATAPTRAEAAELANAFAEETLAFIGGEAQEAQARAIEEANDEVARLQAEIDDLEAQIDAQGGPDQAGALSAQRDAKIRQYALALDEQTQILDQPPPSAGYLTLAEATTELAKPADGGFEAPRSRPVRVGLAALLGLALGLGAILIAERLDPRIHTRADAAEAFSLPVVAEVPRGETARGRPSIALVNDPLSAAAEAYRNLRAAVLLTPVSHLGARPGAHQADVEPHVILVTSPTPGEGKTTTVANLAAAFAETGRSVLVLSCDFRRPEVHHHFDAPQRPGLSDVLPGRLPLEEVARSTFVNGVYLAPDGGGLKHLGDLAAEGYDLVQKARALADIVVIDTAPVLATNDAAELIHAVDAVVVVCRSGGTTTEAAKRSRSLLERLGTPVVGVVLVGVPDSESSYSGYYTKSTPEPARPRIPLRRTIRSPELDERLRPWRVTESGLPRAEDSTEQT